MIVNKTGHAVAEAVLMSAEGRELFVVAAKATFQWSADGTLRPLEQPIPLATVDAYSGPPATSSLIAAGEITLPKPRVDVLVAGEIVLRSPAGQIDCTLEVGDQLFKAVRVFGDRHWRRSHVQSMLPSRPAPFIRMPIAWERAFGGSDPDDPSCVDRRNPSGRGLRRKVERLEGHAVPNFEDPRAPITDPLRNPEPVGLGPIAPHWKPRSDFVGTYDQAWRDGRFPLLPVDFDPRFLNVAPADQQLVQYRPGVEVRLTNFTPAGRARFVLPAFAPNLIVIDAGTIKEVPSVVDTVIIEPAAARVSIIARAAHAPRDVQALATAFLGPLSDRERRALRKGKPLA